MEILENLPDPPVEPCALGGRDVFVDGLPDQCMAEPVTPHSMRLTHDDLGRERRVEHLEERLAVQPTHTLEAGQVEVASDDRRDREPIPTA